MIDKSRIAKGTYMTGGACPVESPIARSRPERYGQPTDLAEIEARIAAANGRVAATVRRKK